MQNIIENENLKEKLFNEIKSFKENKTIISHPYDLAKDLEKLRDENEHEYKYICKKMPSELFAEVLCEMPSYVQEEITEIISEKKVANITSKMDSDDASALIQNISHKDEEYAEHILERLDDEDKQIIEKLNSYSENECGHFMQSEFFKVYEDESIEEAIIRLKELKKTNILDNIFHAHIVNKEEKFIGSLGFEELILYKHSQKFSEISKEKLTHYVINDKADIDDAVEMFSHYDLNVLLVIDENQKILGRITHDDIYDIIQQQDTKQLYSLAGVDDEAEQEESLYKIGKNRAFWLSINLITAILASIVIGLFDSTIQSLVALAVLMPIVASMGGNAGTQSLTVTVRQITLGEISYDDAKKTIYKEVIIALVNGFLFAFIIGLIAYFWFNIPLLGLVIAISMVINLLSAGFFGAVIPIVLEKFNIDPAIGSTVILTTVTDVVGFFSFLGLASLILL